MKIEHGLLTNNSWLVSASYIHSWMHASECGLGPAAVFLDQALQLLNNMQGGR
jgi:hypothetical protein